MRRIEKFETEDGKLFDKQSEAEAHETIYFQVLEIIDLLGGPNSAIDNTSEFANGGGYYTLDFDNHLKANEKMSNLIKQIFNKYLSFTSRQVYEHELLRKASDIYWCITNGKRYGQIFYALNPSIAKDKEFNKRLNNVRFQTVC